MKKYQRGNIGPLIFFVFVVGAFIFSVFLIIKELKKHHNEQKEKTLSYEILTVRGCEYLKLIGNYGYGVAIIEVADQPSTCKYNIFKLSEIKKR